MFVDTHCHLNMMVSKKLDVLLDKEHFILIGKFVEEADEVKVAKIINVGTSVSETLNSVKIASLHKNIFASAAIHPCDCTPEWREDFKEVERLAKEKYKNKIVAIGETGLDFYHKPFDRDRQVDAFKLHIDLALKFDLALIIHIRDAINETLKILEEYKGEVRGVAHCFVHDKETAALLVEWGFHLGIGGPITYPKNEYLRNVVRDMPLEKILLESDSPFLPPQQFRGQRNHPKYIPFIAQTISEVKVISLDKVALVTTKNAESLFGMSRFSL